MKINDILPDADVLLALQPEELAGVLLELLFADENGSGMNR